MQWACSATLAECSVSAVVAEPTEVSLNVHAVPMQWLQCHRRWIQYVVMDDAVPTKVDAVSLC